jgi:flagellar protein FlaJ
VNDEAVESGVRPDEIGRPTSDNVVAILGLRKLRHQAAGTVRGILHGTAAGSNLALFSALGELDDAPVSVPGLPSIDDIHLPVLQAIALTILIANAEMSSVVGRLVDGGTPVRGLTDVTALVWISHVVAFGSQEVLESVLGGAFEP